MLIYKYKGNTSDVDFNKYIGAIHVINEIKNGNNIIKKAINDQYELKIKIRRNKKRKPTKEVNNKRRNKKN